MIRTGRKNMVFLVLILLLVGVMFLFRQGHYADTTLAETLDVGALDQVERSGAPRTRFGLSARRHGAAISLPTARTSRFHLEHGRILRRRDGAGANASGWNEHRPA